MSGPEIEQRPDIQRIRGRDRLPRLGRWQHLQPFLLLVLVACGEGDSALRFADSLAVAQGGFIDIPLHNSVAGDVLTLSASPAPVNGTLTLAADAAAVRYQSNGVGVGEESFTFTIRRAQTTVEEHNVAIMVWRTDARLQK